MVRDYAQLSADTVFDVLCSSRRRATLYLLRTRNDIDDVADLADRITAIENGVPVPEIERSERKRVYVSLYQTHVPKLEAHDLVEVDDETLRATPRAEAIDRFLPSHRPETGTNRRHCIVTGVTTIGTLVAMIASVPAQGGYWLLFMVISLIVGGSGLIGFVRRRRRADRVPAELRP